MTGWNLPPGCTDRMVDEAFGCRRDPSELSENVRALLEKSVVSKQTMEAILEMIEEDEREDEDYEDPDDARDARADYLYDRDR